MKKSKKTFLRITVRTVLLQLKCAPIHSIINILLGVFHALLLTAGVITTQKLYDAIVLAASGKMNFVGCAWALVFLAIAKFGHQIIKGIHNTHEKFLINKTRGSNKEFLHHKLQRLNPILFENPSFLDSLNKAQEGIEAISYFSTTIFLLLGLYGIYIVSIGVYLYKFKSILLLLLLVAYIPAMFIQAIRMKVFTNLEDVTTPIRRESDYYKSVICSRDYIKETRMLGAYQYFNHLYMNTLKILLNKNWHAKRKIVLLELLMNLITFIGMVTATLILFRETMLGYVSIGAFAAIYGALNSIFNTMSEVINMHIGVMTQNVGKIVNYFNIIDSFDEIGGIEGKKGIEGKIDFSKGIIASNISFAYPGRKSPAISKVSITINRGETIAIVGENGAGKSTLVRLLTGIYKPTEGSVVVGGLDTKKSELKSIYKGISVVFQKFQRYSMTLTDNVTISNMSEPIDMSRLRTVLKDADVNNVMDLDVILSPEFGGIDLSGGQWQRLAIARGLYRDSGFIALDEPTAAIDPIEETHLYEKFQYIVEGKCAIIVTHRLGSAKLADRIIVLDKGELIDVGTHDELLSHQGKYAEMWMTQSKWYDRKQ